MEREQERRELAERAVHATAHVVEGAAEAERRRADRAIELAEERVRGAEVERAAMAEKLRVLEASGAMAQAQASAAEAEQRRLQRRNTQVEARLRKEHGEAEDRWRGERSKLKAHVAKLSEELAVVGRAAELQAEAHTEQVRQAEAARERTEAEAEYALSALREEVQIAGLATQIATEHKDRELTTAYAALEGAKRSALRRLDVRWERMLLALTWRAWYIQHVRSRHERQWSGMQQLAAQQMQRSAAATQAEAGRGDEVGGDVSRTASGVGATLNKSGERRTISWGGSLQDDVNRRPTLSSGGASSDGDSQRRRPSALGRMTGWRRRIGEEARRWTRLPAVPPRPMILRPRVVQTLRSRPPPPSLPPSLLPPQRTQYRTSLRMRVATESSTRRQSMERRWPSTIVSLRSMRMKFCQRT